MTTAPPPPLPRLSLGITGHRETNPAYAAHRAEADAMLEALFVAVDAMAAAEAATLGTLAPTRLNNLLACGADQVAAVAAQIRGWELVAPLPFGRTLNLAINALPETLADAQALLQGKSASDPGVAARAEAIARSYETARLFELAEQDAAIERLFLDKLAEPANHRRLDVFNAHCSERVAVAGLVMIAQSDIVFAIWDGTSRSHVGGTGHTIAAALGCGTPVIWIDPARAGDWRILSTPESLFVDPGSDEDREAALVSLVRSALRPDEGGALRAGAQVLASEAWHPRSSWFWTGYRRIEAIFGGQGRRFRSLVQVYETPDEIGSSTGTGAPLMAAARVLTASDPEYVPALDAQVLHRFAWADGISARLSDFYRGGMVTNFISSVIAVAVGLAYQPLDSHHHKWAFSLGEFLALSTILVIIWVGRRQRWHKRWFETRRVAEYFRHAPILLLLGVARPPGRWPKGIDTSWPEYYARHGLRTPGLPRVVITPAYLRHALGGMLDEHVTRQRDYHLAKSERLTTVHERLDRLSQRLFQLAVLSVSLYLLMMTAAAAGIIPSEWPENSSKLFTYFGVMFPTLGAGIAGIRYFGDFERFAAISDVTAEKLDNVHRRIRHLLDAPDGMLDYAAVAELAHTVDDIVVVEIEGWQSVFGGKHITVPV